MDPIFFFCYSFIFSFRQLRFNVVRRETIKSVSLPASSWSTSSLAEGNRTSTSSTGKSYRFWIPMVMIILKLQETSSKAEKMPRDHAIAKSPYFQTLFSSFKTDSGAKTDNHMMMEFALELHFKTISTRAAGALEKWRAILALTDSQEQPQAAKKRLKRLRAFSESQIMSLISFYQLKETGSLSLSRGPFLLMKNHVTTMSLSHGLEK